MASFSMYGGPRQSCPAEEQCSDWIFTYLGDCVCNFRDSISFVLGLASVLSWGVAEIPQIVANFTAGSTEGVSLTFLLTWTFGDFFNLAGCYLEPATLPTQFYMALLYTITTIVLVAQSVYYEILSPPKEGLLEFATEEEQAFVQQQEGRAASQPVPMAATAATSTPSISVPLSRKSSAKEIYITSARSLVSSHTPTLGGFLPGSAGAHHHHPAVGSHLGGNSVLSQSPGVGFTHTYNTTRALALGAVLLSGGLCLRSLQAWGEQTSSSSSALPSFAFSTRKLMQFQVYGSRAALREGGDGSVLGQTMGWLMAAIYMGGRLPQIWLNIKRGTVEGLSPLMFLFALIGNMTYVGSILVRSLDWNDLQPNMAWLVDAGVCVCLDFFILGQFVYYAIVKPKDEEGDTEDDYAALK